jgi:tRNA modification GTPase
VDLLPQAAERLRAASPDPGAVVGRALGQELFASLWGPEDRPEGDCYAISAGEGLGIDALAEGLGRALTGAVTADSDSGGGDIAPNLRQSQLLRRTLPELDQLAEALRAGHPPDILGVHLEAAMQLLEEVSGATDNEGLLDRIFSEFCIGK